MVTLLIAVGPNDLEIPCVVFRSTQEAQKKLNALFGIDVGTSFAVEEMQEKEVSGNYEVFFRYFDKRSFKGITSNYYGGRLSYEDCLVGNKVNVKEFFTRYYSGCGACGGFYLEELQEDKMGSPLVAWDLD